MTTLGTYCEWRNWKRNECMTKCQPPPPSTVLSFWNTVAHIHLDILYYWCIMYSFSIRFKGKRCPIYSSSEKDRHALAAGGFQMLSIAQTSVFRAQLFRDETKWLLTMIRLHAWNHSSRKKRVKRENRGELFRFLMFVFICRAIAIVCCSIRTLLFFPPFGTCSFFFLSL